MKLVLIIFDQVYYECIIVLLDCLGCWGFIYLECVQGCGLKIGDLYFGSYVWFSMCLVIIMVVDDKKVDLLLDVLYWMDMQIEQFGLWVFVINVE